MTTEAAPEICVAKRRQFLYVEERVDGPVPRLGNAGSPYSFQSYTRLCTDDVIIESGVNGKNAWNIKKQNKYAYFVQMLGRDEESVTAAVFQSVNVAAVAAKVKFQPSGVAVNFSLHPGVDGGEECLTAVWAQILASFSSDMVRVGGGIEREQWRLTYVDADRDQSLLTDAATLHHAMSQTLRGGDGHVLRMSLALAGEPVSAHAKLCSVGPEEDVDPCFGTNHKSPLVSAAPSA
jgi:hypothetical protein